MAAVKEIKSKEDRRSAGLEHLRRERTERDERFDSFIRLSAASARASEALNGAKKKVSASFKGSEAIKMRLTSSNEL